MAKLAAVDPPSGALRGGQAEEVGDAAQQLRAGDVQAGPARLRRPQGQAPGEGLAPRGFFKAPGGREGSGPTHPPSPREGGWGDPLSGVSLEVQIDPKFGVPKAPKMTAVSATARTGARGVGGQNG